jgi:hypothetical protein
VSPHRLANGVECHPEGDVKHDADQQYDGEREKPVKDCYAAGQGKEDQPQHQQVAVIAHGRGSFLSEGRSDRGEVFAPYLHRSTCFREAVRDAGRSVIFGEKNSLAPALEPRVPSCSAKTFELAAFIAAAEAAIG